MSSKETTVATGKETPKKRKMADPEQKSLLKRSKQETKNDFEDVMLKVKGEDKELAVKYAKRLKTMLPNRAKIEAFVGHRKNLEDLVAVFSRETSLLGTSLYHEDLHKYSISIIANCCFTDKTPSTGFQVKKAQRSFLDLAVRIFESTTSNIEIRVSMCRLIGNLCNSKELVTSWLSSNTILFDRIALLLESTNESIVSQCLRIFQYLANHSFTRVIMLSNAGFYLGKLLMKNERRGEVVKILKVLLKRHMNVLDRQLSSSACNEQVVEMFFEENSKNRQFVIDLFSNSVCIREQMETEGFIEQLLACSIPEKNRMLAAFSQTAWGRAKLRTSGALDVLIEVFSSSEHIDEKLAIVAAFRHFVHDTAGMRHLSENSIFVNTVVRDVNLYVETNRCECEPTVETEFVKSLRRSNDDNNAEGQANNSVEAPGGRLHKDFYSMWSYDTPQMSPRRAHSASMSPQYNSPSPSYSFPSSVASSPAASPAARRPSDGILDELSDVESDNEQEEKEEEEGEAEKVKKQEKSIVDGELWLLTWLAQDDHNLQFLIRPDVVDCVVSYLRSTAFPDFRTYRVLRRMATHRTYVYRLLDLQFHVRILTGLCASPCRMLKYAKYCKQCDTCSEHGREILREFASHVDNSYGDAHINSQFTKEDFVHRTKAAIAKIVLVKERIRLAKVPALTELFNALAHIMSSPENFKELGKVPTYENGPSFASQIIGALSILISGQKIKELCEHDMWYFPAEEGVGTCEIESAAPTEEILHFVDENNEQIVKAPMKKICENSHYFEGMYSSNFVEKTEGIRTFQVQSESCQPEDFRLFIHLLSTCSSSCTLVSSAEQCATLLALSDQFLCPRISQQLCADDGPLRTYLNGRSLHTLLPVALATNAHPTLLDTVYLTLVRFSSSEDVTKALETICENTTVVNTFVTSLRTFLTTKC